jgi:hypothetical protein
LPGDTVACSEELEERLSDWLGYSPLLLLLLLLLAPFGDRLLLGWSEEREEGEAECGDLFVSRLLLPLSVVAMGWWWWWWWWLSRDG